MLSVTLIFSASKFKADVNILKHPGTSLRIDKKHDADLSWEARQLKDFCTYQDSQDWELLAVRLCSFPELVTGIPQEISWTINSRKHAKNRKL